MDVFFIFKPGQGVRKVRPNNRAGLVTVKPKNNAAKNPTNKANELDNKVDEKVRKTTVQAKEETSKDNNQDEVKEQNVTNLPPKSTETENNLVKVKEAANEQPKVNKVENIETKAKEKVRVVVLVNIYTQTFIKLKFLLSYLSTPLLHDRHIKPRLHTGKFSLDRQFFFVL